MRYTLPLCLGLTLASQAASAAENMLLRIQQNQSSGQTRYELTHAQRGNFSVTPKATASRDGDLEVVGRDRRNRELFRTRISHPGVIQAEAFNPKTRQIEYAREIELPASTFEVSVPASAELDHIELVNPGSQQQGARLEQRLERSQLDAQISQSGRVSAMLVQAMASKTALYTSGPSANRMDIVLVGDGYTSAEMSKWASDAQKVANGLLADPLFNANKAKFNISRVDVVSNQSGVDEPDRGIYRDTALGVQIGCYNVDRLVCANETLVYNQVGSVTSADARDVIVVVANSTRYGGAGGNVATMTMHPSAIELALHEIGHTAFKLADEYDYGSCDTSREPTEANVTMQTARNSIKWRDLIPGNVPVPTPAGTYANGTVGLFTGGKYCTAWMYRPTENSRMRSLGQPWHAVNERRANAVFASYAGTQPTEPTPVTLTGSLASRAWVNLPTSGALTSSQGGNIKLQLTGPANADFDLILYKWNGSAWAAVANGNGPTSSETLNYAASAGYYYFEVNSYSGSGTYTLTYTFPK